MVTKISQEKAIAIVHLYLAGLDEKKIAKKLKVAQSTVNLCINRFIHEYETMPEYTIKKYHIEDVIRDFRLLSIELRKNKTTPEEARKGVKVRAQMDECGVKDSDIPKLLSIIKKEGFVSVALKLLKLESNGTTYENIVAEYQQKESVLIDQQKQIDKNRKTIESQKEKKSTISQQRENEEQRMQNVLRKNKITEEKLDITTNLIGRNLSQNGLNKNDIEQLTSDASEVGGLAQQRKNMQQEKKQLETAINDLVSEKTSHDNHIKNQAQTITKNDSEIQNKNVELSRLNGEIQTAKKELSELNIKMEEKGEILKNAETVMTALNSKDVYMFNIDGLMAILQNTKYAKSSGNNEAYKLFAKDAQERLVRILTPLIRDEFVSKTVFDAKEIQYQNLQKNFTQNYVPKIEHEVLKADFERTQTHAKELTRTLNESRLMHEHVIDELKAGFAKRIAKQTEEIKNLHDAMELLAPLVVWYNKEKKEHPEAVEAVTKNITLIKQSIMSKSLQTN